MLRNPEITNSY